MEEIVSRIVSELETLQNLNDLESQTPFSRSTLSDLQTMFDNNLEGAAESDRLWEEMSTRNLSPALIVRPIAASMDSGPIHLTLLASRVYLSILLSPNSPVFTLFTPIAFLSFLRSLRRSLKRHQSGPPFPAADEGGSGIHKANRQRKRGGGGRGSGNVFCSADEVGEEIDENRFDFKVLFPVLEKLDSVLDRIHLDRFPDGLKSLIQTLAEIPIMGLELYENSTSYKKLSDLCYGILNRVLGAEHGDQTITAAEVLKSLSPAILLLKSQARTFALRFVTHQMLAAAKDCDAIRKAVVYLPRYLVHKAPGKSEPRSCAVESIMEIVRAMEFEDQIGFVDYVVKMSKGKSELRLLAVDLVPTLMMSLRDPLGINSEQEESFWGLGCVEALIQRCSDAVAGIRARALSNLAQVLGYLSGDVRSQGRLKEVMGFKKMGRLSWENEINDLIRKRCMDEKAAVRKAALILITKSTALLGDTIDGTMLRIMGMACWDPLVSIRKAAISALSEAFRKFSDEKVITEWLHSVPRLITDNESSIQEECENLFLELILDRLSRVGSVSSHHSTASYSHSNTRMKKFQEIENVFPEGVLVLLKGICNGEVAPFVKKICASLGKKKRLKPTIAIALQNIIRTSESLSLSHSLPIKKWMAPPGSWFLLSEVSAYLSKAVNWEFLHHHWQLVENQMEGGVRCPFVSSVDDEGDGMDPNSVAWAGDRVYLLQILSNVSLELAPEPAASLAHDLLKRIEEFNMHSTEVNAHVKALRTLCKRKALNAEEGDTLTAQWVCKLLSKALQILEAYISEALASKDDSFLTPPRSGGWKKKRGETMSRSLLQAVTAVYTIGSLAMVCHSADFKGIVPVLHKIITSGSSEPKMKKLPGPNVSVKEIAPSLYIQSWITMGKICLVDEKLAKRYIPLFVQELEKSESAALRNNIVVMMADFCVRYTALVDCYISKITKCLRDPCEIVRRQTFILLSRLLQRDYVKWRGVLFIQFLLSLVDESEKIKQLADFLFGNILKAKAPLLAYNSFVEAIFVLNDCHAHAGHSESQGSRTESKLFSIRGDDEKSRSERMHIYVSLLKQMAPEHLLATCAKLCSEILAAASDGLLNIEDATGQCVLKDAFQILSCKEIRIPSNRETAADITEMDEEGRDGAAAAAAGGRVVTQAVKRNLIQNAVPIFIELKRLLESKCSPLTGCLMDCLRVLLKDYKNEIDDILVADKQLQKELMYDTQKHEAAKAKSKVAEAVATLPRSDRYPSTPGFESGVSKLANGGEIHSRLAEKLGSAERVASAMADVAAEARVKSVLRDIKGGVSTPPLKSINLPKLKSSMEGVVSGGERPLNVLESLRRRESFDSDDET